jgi:hypothetical protein
MAEQAGWAALFLWDHVLAVPGLEVAYAWTTRADGLQEAAADDLLQRDAVEAARALSL